MTEQELREQIRDAIRLYYRRDGGYREDNTIDEIIDLCRAHFEQVPDGMEEWWIGVSRERDGLKDGSNRKCTRCTYLYRTKEDCNYALNETFYELVRLFLPRPETERQKLIHQINVHIKQLEHVEDTVSYMLLKRAADELGKWEG